MSDYLPTLEISKAYATWQPSNCAVIERTADGVSVGPCTYFLKNGTHCPRHGQVKMTESIASQPVKTQTATALSNPKSVGTATDTAQEKENK